MDHDIYSFLHIEVKVQVVHLRCPCEVIKKEGWLSENVFADILITTKRIVRKKKK